MKTRDEMLKDAAHDFVLVGEFFKHLCRRAVIFLRLCFFLKFLKQVLIRLQFLKLWRFADRLLL